MEEAKRNRILAGIARRPSAANYDVRFSVEPGAGNYASIEPDPASCTAICRVDLELCEREQQTEQVAAHEVLHLLLAELRHAASISDETADWVEEQTVRKIEAVVFKGLFTQT